MRFEAVSLESYLTAKRGRAAAVDNIHQVGRRNSRETWFVDYRLDGKPHKVTFRPDHPSGAIVPTPLRQDQSLYLHEIAEETRPIDPAFTGRGPRR